MQEVYRNFPKRMSPSGVAILRQDIVESLGFQLMALLIELRGLDLSFEFKHGDLGVSENRGP